MHLLNPIALIALAGLLIPLIIHLWKLKQGKTLRIGSIALLGAGSPFTSRSYQITDWLLLFLRMLLLALVAFFLAEPYMKDTAHKEVQKGWVLLEKTHFPAIYKTQKKSIDSLMKAGYELHDFGLNFQPINLNDTVAVNIADTLNKLSHYALLRELNANISPNFPVYLYTDRRLEHLTGVLPRIDFRLIWKEIKGTDTLSTWNNTFANKTFETKSSPALTQIKRLDEEQDASKIKVLIYAADQPEDVNYLKAAIQAIAQETKRNVELVEFNGKNINNLSFDVGFWISDKPMNSSFLSSIRKDGRLFNYEGEKGITSSSWLDTEPNGKGNIPGMTLTRRTSDATYSGATLWTDGFGVPLLTRTKEKTINHYRFYSRFNPLWTDLVWKEKFVEAMMPVILGDDGSDAGFGFGISPNDQRNSQLDLTESPERKFSGPRSLSGVNLEGNPVENHLSVQKIFWLIALLVFTIERIISFRHKNKVNHG